jgi:hypothetical protein
MIVHLARIILEQKGDPNRICRGNDLSRFRLGKKTQAQASKSRSYIGGTRIREN